MIDKKELNFLLKMQRVSVLSRKNIYYGYLNETHLKHEDTVS